MKLMFQALLLSACLVGSNGYAAAKTCHIKGNFTDTLGSSGKFTSQKKGTVDNANICPKPYKLTVTKLSLTEIDLSGTSAAKSCGALTASLAFQDNGCDVASGTVTIAGLGTLNDTVTRSSSNVVRPSKADTSALTAGLK